MNLQGRSKKKKAVNLAIDAERLKEPKDAGLDLSKVLDEELHRRRVEAWKRENADAIRQLNAYIDENGIWFEGARTW